MEKTIGAADPAAETAKNMFGISYLYPWQRLVIANIMDAVDMASGLPREGPEETVCGGDFPYMREIVLLPTGAGKSLCFMIPALLSPGLTLIVYPLLALMADQERRLKEAGIGYALIRGGQSGDERRAQLKALDGGAKIIIANPEVLANPHLLAELKKRQIIHAVIDEAHCVCEWGDTFRPAYLEVGTHIRELGIPVITAFTATASEPVLERISQILFNRDAHILRGETDRPNISYEVIPACNKFKTALELIKTAEKPLLIFCGTRGGAEKLARSAAVLYGRDTVRFYHAGLERMEKIETERWFYSRENAVLTATCAYGLGVDKKNIRTVVHLDVPPTVEAYVQEAGRGGRDGNPSRAILLWSPEDRTDFISASGTEANRRRLPLAHFAAGKSCRRQILLDALGGEKTVCSGCDVCSGQVKSYPDDGRRVLEFIGKNPGIYTLRSCAAPAAEYINRRKQMEGGFPLWNESDTKEAALQLCREGLLTEKGFPWDKSKRLYISEGTGLSSFPVA